MKIKAKRKLLPAILTLLVATLVTTNATYAWFSMNTTVSATGMKVTAKVAGSLYISNATAKPDATAITASTVDFAMEQGTELKPTSTATLANNAWYSAAAVAPTAYAKTGDYAAVNEGDLDGYRLLKTVYVRGEVGFTNLQVTGITINTTNDDVIDDALTVAIKCIDAGGASQFFSNEVSTNRHGAVAAGGLTTLTFTQVSGTGLSNVILASGAANTVYTVEIYIYYDGESTSCYTNAANAVSVDGCTVGVTLGATFS